MLTKEECLKELENSRFLTVSVINQDGQTEYSSDFEQTAVFNTFKQLIEEYFNPQPYKFEELYKNMYVWVHWFKEDPTKGHPVWIEGTGYNDKGEQVVYYVWNDSSGTYAFDAFIFYPLTIALKIPKPTELTRFERDFLSAYYFEGTNIPNSRLMDHDFFIDLKTRGYYKNVDMKMTVRDVLERAVVKDG